MDIGKCIDIHIDKKKKSLVIEYDLRQLKTDGMQNYPAKITNIAVYGTKSYLDGMPVFEKDVEPNSEYKGTVEMDQNVANNVNEQFHTGESIDLSNDIVITVVSLDYDNVFSASESCCNMPSVWSYAMYDPCKAYSTIFLNSAGMGDSKCDNEINYALANGLMQKKLIDLCIDRGNYDLAC